MEPEERLKESLASVAGWLEESLHQGGAFVMEQAPLVVEQFITFETWKAVMEVVVCSLLLVVSTTAVAWGLLSKPASTVFCGERSEGQFMAALVGGALSLLTLAALLPQAVLGLIKIKTAPAVVVLEKIGELL